MPSLWRKKSSSSSSSSSSKGNRISRFVADLQSPPKRGGSLVVETGFPTSLVDLFVKNRDRLKKKQSKKRASVVTQQSMIPNTQFVKDDLPILVSRDLEVTGCDISTKTREIGEIACGEEGVGCVVMGVEEIEGRRGRKRIGVIWVLKVAVVVVLALCTKKFVFGITIAAFLLVLIEYMGDRLLGLWNRGRDLDERLRWVCCWVGFEREGNAVEEGYCGVACDGNNNIVEEIESLNEDRFCHDDEIEVELDVNGCAKGIDETMSPCSSRFEIEDMESKEIVVVEGFGVGSEVCKNGKEGKKGKFWKRLVPKKLDKRRKKKNKDVKGKQSDDDDVSVAKWSEREEDDDEQKEQADVINEDDPPSSSSSSSSPPFLKEKGGEGVRSSKETMQPHDGVKVDEMLIRRSSRNVLTMKYMPIIMVALAGLLIGRIAALALTLICCLMFKRARSFAR